MKKLIKTLSTTPHRTAMGLNALCPYQSTAQTTNIDKQITNK